MSEDPKLTSTDKDKDIKENRIIAAIGYIFLLCLIPLFQKRKSEFAQFHGKQGLMLVICWFILWFIGVIPILGWIIWLLGLIFSFIGVFKRPKGLSIAGLVISLIGIVLLIVVFGSFLGSAMQSKF